MLPNFDDGRWQVVEVPLPWDLYDTAGFGGYDGSSYGTGTAFRDGYAWYRVGFSAPDAWSGRFVKVCFLGVSYAASVYLNGTLVAEHEGGHTPFTMDVSAVLLPGARNLLAVRVYRRPWYRQGVAGLAAISCRTELPHKPVDYWPYAGITRGVFIEATAQVTVSKLLTSARHGRLAVAAVVFNHGAGRPAAAWSLIRARAPAAHRSAGIWSWRPVRWAWSAPTCRSLVPGHGRRPIPGCTG